MFNKNKEMLRSSEHKKPKPPFYKRGWFIGLAGVIIGAGLIGGDDEEAIEEPNTEEVAEEVVEEVEAAEEDPQEEVIEEEDTKEEVVEEEPVDEEVIEEVAEEETVASEEVSSELEEELNVDVTNDFVISFLQGTEMGNMGVFEYDEEMNAATYLITDSDAADAFSLMAAGMFLDDYASLRENYISISESMGEISDLSFVLLNPSNPDNILLLILNGVILYDFVDEL